MLQFHVSSRDAWLLCLPAWRNEPWNTSGPPKSTGTPSVTHRCITWLRHGRAQGHPPQSINSCWTVSGLRVVHSFREDPPPSFSSSAVACTPFSHNLPWRRSCFVVSCWRGSLQWACRPATAAASCILPALACRRRAKAATSLVPFTRPCKQVDKAWHESSQHSTPLQICPWTSVKLLPCTGKVPRAGRNWMLRAFTYTM